MSASMLLAVPNVSEGRDGAAISALARAFSGEPRPADDPWTAASSGEREDAVRLLDVHSDPDHHRSVYTLVGRQGRLADALLAGAREAIRRIDVFARPPGELGAHPHVGAVDVVPLVYLDTSARGAACAEALLVADRIGSELGVPVILYGELSASEPGAERTRAQLRRGGPQAIARRIAPQGAPAAGALPDQADQGAQRAPLVIERLAPDFGPARAHPSAGVTLVAARPPLVAFNLRLSSPGTPQDARRIAALIREGGAAGLPGVRAIGVSLAGGVGQVSMNIERPFDVSLAEVVRLVRRHAPLESAELVGLAPAVALEGFPEDLPIPGFDPSRHLIENALGW